MSILQPGQKPLEYYTDQNGVHPIFDIAEDPPPTPQTVLADGNITLGPLDNPVLVTTSSAVTITFPEGCEIGHEIKIMRTVASANAITVARSGSELIEGAATFAFKPGALEVSFKKITATTWARIDKAERTDWSTKGVIENVIGQLAWKNYGNNHTIFDASAGTSPNGGAVDKSNPQQDWVATYPTLMGWNGSATYGVKVDRARYCDTAPISVAYSHGAVSGIVYMPAMAIGATSMLCGYGYESLHNQTLRTPSGGTYRLFFCFYSESPSDNIYTGAVSKIFHNTNRAAISGGAILGSITGQNYFTYTALIMRVS